MLFYALAHGFAEGLDIGRARAAEIDQEIAVHLRHLGGADDQPAATRGIDQLPRFLSRWILEGGAAGAALDRLRRLARLRDLVHFSGNLGRVAGLALEQRLREDHVVRRAAV